MPEMKGWCEHVLGSTMHQGSGCSLSGFAHPVLTVKVFPFVLV